jgi:hypothetical protein
VSGRSRGVPVVRTDANFLPHRTVFAAARLAVPLGYWEGFAISRGDTPDAEAYRARARDDEPQKVRRDARSACVTTCGRHRGRVGRSIDDRKHASRCPFQHRLSVVARSREETWRRRPHGASVLVQNAALWMSRRARLSADSPTTEGGSSSASALPDHPAEPRVLLLRHRRRRLAARALARDRLDDDRAGVISPLAASSLYARASPCSRRPRRRESGPRRRCRASRAPALAAAGILTVSGV